MDKVVKCKNGRCGQYFMHTEKNTKCPFCHIEYGEAGLRPGLGSDTKSEEKTKEKEIVGVEEKPKERKVIIKSAKESFKIWNDS